MKITDSIPCKSLFLFFLMSSIALTSNASMGGVCKKNGIVERKRAVEMIGKSVMRKKTDAAFKSVVPDPPFIEPSKDKPLIPGQKLITKETSRIGHGYTIQRLTERIYWIESDFFASTIYVGDTGVLLVDPLPTPRGQVVLEAIKEISPLPVTALVYSHTHHDHVGGAKFYVDEGKKNGVTVDVVGSVLNKETIRRFDNNLPMPTKLIKGSKGVFCFDGAKVFVKTGMQGHANDMNLILFVDEKVLHVPDMIWPTRLPTLNFFAPHELLGYEKTLKFMLRLDWNILNASHGNIGAPSDVAMALEYLTDIRNSFFAAVSQVNPSDYIYNSAEVSFSEMFLGMQTEVIKNAVEIVRPKWGRYEDFDFAAPTHVEEVFTHFFHDNH